ncbi:MAG: ABC transporter permease, partial [Ignavibacteriaceae bacterium]
MLKNYLKIAFRNLARKKIFSFINISGLAVGMACTILILLWVQDELSYDDYHKNKDNLYRVVYEWRTMPGLHGVSPGMLAPESKNNIPGIVEAARILKRPKMVIKAIGTGSKDEPAFYEEEYYLADPEIFKMFTLPFIKGNPETALNNGMVITRSIAVKYFGTTEVLGKRLNVNGWFDTNISGVIEDIPSNSHFNFKMFSRLEDLKYFFPAGFTWGNTIHQTYIQLADGVSAEIIAKKLENLNRVNNQRVAKDLKSIWLQPLRDVYLNAEVAETTVKQGDKTYVYIFSAIAFAILLIACINFINLSTAQASARVRSIGTLKIIGANRLSLVKQMLGESLFLSFISALIAVLLVEISLPLLNRFAEKNLSLVFYNYWVITGLFALVIVTGLIAGAIPAIYFSGFKPMQAFRDNWISSRSSGLRRGLVVFQYVASIFLIIVTLIVSGQLDFMQNQKLGFQKENIICFPVKGNTAKQYPSFRNELLRHPTIKNAAIKNSIPTDAIYYTRIRWEGMDPQQELISEISEVDYNFFNTLGLEIAEGRNFSTAYSSDLADAFIVNEETVRQMGLKNPLGAAISTGDRKGRIIGVIKDAHFKTLKQPIAPIIFIPVENISGEVMDLFGVIFVSFNPDKIQEAVNSIKS